MVDVGKRIVNYLVLKCITNKKSACINVHTYTVVIRHCSPYSHCCVNWLFTEREREFFNEDVLN